MREARTTFIIGGKGWGKTVCRRLLNNSFDVKEHCISINIETYDMSTSDISSERQTNTHYFINSVLKQLPSSLNNL